METKPYPQYKESGIKWIGKIPKDWSSHRIKDFLEFDIGGTPSTSHEEYFEGDNIWISIADLTSNKKNTINTSKTKISDEAIKKSNVKLIKKGSLLFSFKLTIGKTAFAGCDLYTNEAIAAFKQNKNMSLNYLKYLLKVGFENNAFENIYGAKIFNSDLIKFAKIIKPPLVEQEQIAKYLDKKTKKIEQTITKNKKLITLLKEKRTTLINQTVTKGLNPDAPMKESGIEWIGKIPEHWNIKTLKNITSFNPSVNINSLNEDSIITYTPMENIKKGEYINKSAKLSEIPNNLTRYEEGDIVLAKVTPCFENGNLAIMNNLYSKHGFGSSELFVIRAKEIFKKYIFYWLQTETFIQKACSTMHGVAGLQRIDSHVVKNSKIPYPPLNEQEDIANNLDMQTQKIDRSIEKVEKNIELLEEYKESLIHHVVTGKIDVRGVEV